MESETRELIYVAILKASNLYAPDVDDAEPEATQTPADAEPVENGVFGQGDTESPTEADADLSHADHVEVLHQRGYRWEEIYGLLAEEITTLAEGAKRRQRKSSGSSEGVQTNEGTRVKGGPAQGANSISMVDADGNPLTN